MEQELQAARDCYYVLRELIRHHPDGNTNERALATARRLCQSAALGVGDAECRAALNAIEELAAQLFTGCTSAAWVRRQLLRELEWFRACLYALEALSTTPGSAGARRPPA